VGFDTAGAETGVSVEQQTRRGEETIGEREDGRESRPPFHPHFTTIWEKIARRGAEGRGAPPLKHVVRLTRAVVRPAG